MKEVRCTVEELGELCRQRKAVCFGAGDWLMDSFFGERYKRFEFEKSVSAVIDNSPEKQNPYLLIGTAKKGNGPALVFCDYLQKVCGGNC